MYQNQGNIYPRITSCRYFESIHNAKKCARCDRIVTLYLHAKLFSEEQNEVWRKIEEDKWFDSEFQKNINKETVTA
jgi:hypothetical protein